jgi:cyclopropane-fatty-acyl-phospholipid synthase
MLATQALASLRDRLSRQSLPVKLVLWNGESLTPGASAKVTVTVCSPKALLTLARPTMGKLAKCYVEGDIDIEGNLRDVVAAAQALAQAEPASEKSSSSLWQWRRHTRPADRRAIQHHYDVSNDFYGLWLDRNRVYSCAYFKHPDDTLDTAQEQKLDHILRKLDLKENERFLDVGCGWGALILRAVQGYGARALGITLSDNQHAYVQAKIRELELEERCEVRFLDYRDLPEDAPFDKIASVGMFEHVGEQNLPAYFSKIYRLLKPGGLIMNHGITLGAPDSRELGSDIGSFIEEYVFPGGELLHLARVVEALAREGLECWDCECLRPHYAKTLWHWVTRLDERHEEARAIVGEKTYRVWRIYMAGSAHAFSRGWLSVFQILAGRPYPDGALPLPLTRHYVYRGSV